MSPPVGCISETNIWDCYSSTVIAMCTSRMLLCALIHAWRLRYGSRGGFTLSSEIKSARLDWRCAIATNTNASALLALLDNWYLTRRRFLSLITRIFLGSITLLSICDFLFFKYLHGGFNIYSSRFCAQSLVASAASSVALSVLFDYVIVAGGGNICA